MILARGNRICEITSTIGDGAYALDGAIVGYFPFSSACVEGSVCEYAAEAIDNHGALTGPCEVGLGTFGPGNTLARTQIYSGSNGTQPVKWTAGAKRIALTLTVESLQSLPVLTKFADVAAVQIVSINTRLDVFSRFSDSLTDTSDSFDFLTLYQLST